MRRIVLGILLHTTLALLWNLEQVGPLNAKEHDTDMYQQPSEGSPWVIIRRGRSFLVQLVLDKPLETGESVQFHLRDTGGVSQKWKDEKFPPGSLDWASHLEKSVGTTVTYRLNYPPNLWLGRFDLFAQICKGGCVASDQDHQASFNLLVLADPYDERDDAYMADLVQRNEYCFADNGQIWVGSSDNVSPRPWAYDQFSPAAYTVLGKILSWMDLEQRSSLEDVSRFLSSTVNANNGDGLMYGRWDGDYEDGTNPSSWTGSTPILEEYLKTLSPVRYAQCWVFGAVFNTLLRSAGVCARPISNFQSAHGPPPFDGPIKKYYTKSDDGFDFDEMDGSIWNFHVWDDAWFKRGDSAGWQAVDATPQEESDGKYQMGPASLADIYNKNVSLPYDVAFVTMEVSAAIENYVRDSVDQKYKLFSTQYDGTGLLISTKMPALNYRLDITDQYKPVDWGFGPGPFVSFANDLDGYALTLTMTCPGVLVGKDIVVLLEVGMRGSGLPPELPLTVRAHVSAMFMDYTGNHTSSTLKFLVNGTLASVTRKLNMQVTIPAKVYTSVVRGGHHFLGLEASALTDTMQPTLASLRTSLTIPELKIMMAKSRYRVGEQMTGQASFTNPLDVSLTHVVISAQASSGVLIPPITIDEIQPKGLVVIPASTVAARPGTHLFIATLSSDQLSDVVGSVEVNIEAESEQHPVLVWVSSLPPWGIFLLGMLACATLAGLFFLVCFCVKKRRMRRQIAAQPVGQQLSSPLNHRAEAEADMTQGETA